MAMGKEQRDAIRKALNEDAEKLLQQGDPADPQLRRLQREIDEVPTSLYIQNEFRKIDGRMAEWSALQNSMRGASGSIPAKVKTFFSTFYFFTSFFNWNFELS